MIPGSGAEEAGFQTGDCIVAISGQEVTTWTDTGPALVNGAGEPIVFTLDRSGQVTELTLAEENSALEGLPYMDALVGALAPGMPAVEAGLETGDKIISIGDRQIASWYELKDAIQEVGGRPVTVIVERAQERLSFKIVPEQVDDEKSYLIGIAPNQETVFKRFSLGASIRAGADRSMQLIELTLVFMQKLFAGHVSTSNIGGPITVVQIAGQAAQTDLSSILSVLAFLSIQLGILNLLPIPILDGGHLFFYSFEMVFRRPLSLRAREWAQQLGLILLIMLMVLAFYNDIVRMLGS